MMLVGTYKKYSFISFLNMPVQGKKIALIMKSYHTTIYGQQHFVVLDRLFCSFSTSSSTSSSTKTHLHTNGNFWVGSAVTNYFYVFHKNVLRFFAAILGVVNCTFMPRDSHHVDKVDKPYRSLMLMTEIFMDVFLMKILLLLL